MSHESPRPWIAVFNRYEVQLYASEADFRAEARRRVAAGQGGIEATAFPLDEVLMLHDRFMALARAAIELAAAVGASRDIPESARPALLPKLDAVMAVLVDVIESDPVAVERLRKAGYAFAGGTPWARL